MEIDIQNELNNKNLEVEKEQKKFFRNYFRRNHKYRAKSWN